MFSFWSCHSPSSKQMGIWAVRTQPRVESWSSIVVILIPLCPGSFQREGRDLDYTYLVFFVLVLCHLLLNFNVSDDRRKINSTCLQFCPITCIVIVKGGDKKYRSKQKISRDQDTFWYNWISAYFHNIWPSLSFFYSFSSPLSTNQIFSTGSTQFLVHRCRFVVLCGKAVTVKISKYQYTFI